MSNKVPIIKTRKIAIISAEIGWGSGFKAAEMGCQLLFEVGIADQLQATVTRIKSIPSMLDGEITGEETETAIMVHARRVSDAVLDAIQNGMFPVIIGGDHTSALGFHTGLARAHGKTGIIWVDTHPDLNTPETSPSGNIHGMVLAGLLGKGSKKMVATTAACQTKEEHVAMVGIRSIDEGEKKWLDEGTINYMTMDAVKERGLSACLANAVNTANQAEAGFGLTIDLDAIDPSQAPFVATPVDGGLDADELAVELANVLSTMPNKDRLLGMEVVEFTPQSDDPKKDAESAMHLILKLINAATGTVV